ncbi:MAG: hypothetical protein ABW092_20615 [Candidatus Thiodiazotropha sp.]
MVFVTKQSGKAMRPETGIEVVIDKHLSGIALEDSVQALWKEFRNTSGLASFARLDSTSASKTARAFDSLIQYLPEQLTGMHGSTKKTVVSCLEGEYYSILRAIWPYLSLQSKKTIKNFCSNGFLTTMHATLDMSGVD